MGNTVMANSTAPENGQIVQVKCHATINSNEIRFGSLVERKIFHKSS